MFNQNETASVPVISTGVHYNHSYTSNTVPPRNQDIYDSSYYVPNGLNSYNK